MSSIYDIKQQIISLFEEIEDNGGEITEEQSKLLKIAQENLNVKLENYNKAIISWNADIQACKEEEKRIKSVRSKYENRIKRLKDAMLDAVNNFGDDGKSGNKFIELPTARLYTKSTTAVEIDEFRTNALITCFNIYIQKLYTNGCFENVENEEADAYIITEQLNNILIEQYGNDIEPFVVSDIVNCKLDIISNMSIYDYFNNATSILKCIGKNPELFKLINNTPKEEWKIVCNNTNNIEEHPTIAKVVKNQSIQIK